MNNQTKRLKTFEKDGSNLLGHPVKNKDLGIDFSNGSLGMGLSLGIGVAIALKKKHKKNPALEVAKENHNSDTAKLKIDEKLSNL